VFDGCENTKVGCLTKTACGFEAGAVHVHFGMLERLWRHIFDN